MLHHLSALRPICMSHGPNRIPTKGRCIYCGKTDVKLTDEHFLPLSLGGQHIIEEASCLACADITKKFEQDVARGMWGDARITYDAPSRRKKLRASQIKMRTPDDSGKMISVPYDEYPAPFVFYKMNKAGLLEGLPEHLDISSAWQFLAVMDGNKAKEFKQKFGMHHTAKFKHIPESFGRLLAKIGYGQILCNLDLGDFRPLCLPYILGHKRNVSYIVGGSFDVLEPNLDVGYFLKTAAFGDLNRIVLVAEIRLYANAPTPSYHAVVGDVIGKVNVATVWKKLDDTDALVVSQPLIVKLPNTYHWMPSIWPLPL